MRRVALLLALPFVLLTTSGVAFADVPNSPGKCKCSTPGMPAQGSMAGVMAGGGALLLFISRRRRPK
jgi:MYXO-CTERM domain-containing protein